MKLSQSGGIVDETGRLVPVAEIMAEVTAMKVEQTRLAEKLQDYIAMWKASLAEVERLRTAAGKFHDLYHANWVRSSPTFPDCDCELAAALRREGEK